MTFSWRCKLLSLSLSARVLSCLTFFSSTHHASPRYGQWYSPEEIRDLFAPATDTVNAVREWLESAGVAPHRITQSANKQWLQFDAEADEVESLFRTKYYIYDHSATGKSHVACTE